VTAMGNDKGMNREYKDRLFKFIFGNPENKEWTLDLYNAMNGTHYTDVKALRLTTLENAVYMGMKNDVSFLIDDVMSFYEQQSTFNPNMPMRFLIYAGMVYSSYIEGSSVYRRYSPKQQKAPTPKCVCFYNGTTNKDDRTILSLEDAFDSEAEPDIEVKVTMININYGHNKELLESCKPLGEYSWFVDRVRTSRNETDTLEEAVSAAIDELPDDALIKPFLMANKAEVTRMCITEYDEERTYAEMREEAIEEGRAQGRAEGRAEGMFDTLAGLVKDGILTLSEAAKRINMPLSEFQIKAGMTA